MLKPFRLALVLVAIALLLIPASALAQDDGETVAPAMLTHRSATGGYTFDFPATWHMLREGNATHTLVSDPYILYKLDNNFETMFADETLVTISFVPTAYAESGYGITGSNAAERADSLARNLSGDLDIFLPETLDNGIVRVLLRKGAVEAPDFVGILAVWDLAPDLMGVAIMMTTRDNFDAAYDLTEQVMLSAQFNTTVEEVISAVQEANE